MKKDTKWLTAGLVVLAMFLVMGCKVHEPLEGLCYTDTRGTYLCMENDELTPNIIRELEENPLLIDPKKDIFEECKGFEGREMWHWCINRERIA